MSTKRKSKHRKKLKKKAIPDLDMPPKIMLSTLAQVADDIDMKGSFSILHKALKQTTNDLMRMDFTKFEIDNYIEKLKDKECFIKDTTSNTINRIKIIAIDKSTSNVEYTILNKTPTTKEVKTIDELKPMVVKIEKDLVINCNSKIYNDSNQEIYFKNIIKKKFLINEAEVLSKSKIYSIDNSVNFTNCLQQINNILNGSQTPALKTPVAPPMVPGSPPAAQPNGSTGGQQPTAPPMTSGLGGTPTAPPMAPGLGGTPKAPPMAPGLGGGPPTAPPMVGGPPAPPPMAPGNAPRGASNQKSPTNVPVIFDHKVYIESIITNAIEAGNYEIIDSNKELIQNYFTQQYDNLLFNKKQQDDDDNKPFKELTSEILNDHTTLLTSLKFILNTIYKKTEELKNSDVFKQLVDLHNTKKNQAQEYSQDYYNTFDGENKEVIDNYFTYIQDTSNNVYRYFYTQEKLNKVIIDLKTKKLSDIKKHASTMNNKYNPKEKTNIFGTYKKLDEFLEHFENATDESNENIQQKLSENTKIKKKFKSFQTIIRKAKYEGKLDSKIKKEWDIAKEKKFRKMLQVYTARVIEIEEKIKRERKERERRERGEREERERRER